uniref:cellulase family glycosylhydrolase n=1 Tax=Alistipes shahii TaxID=328814 RepID=UPI003FF0EB46
RDRPDKPVRFYGTNLCRSAQYLDKEQAERLADRMAAWGINAVRIHHHDNELVRKTSESSTELNPEALDRLDYLIACFKKRGIYITTDLYVSRMLVRGELTETPDKTAWQPTFKPLVFVLDSAMENWKRFARNWLTHVNPYTGLALKDDPALISLSLINEDNIASTWNAAPYVADIYKQRFGEWKKRRGVTSGSADSNDPVFSAFLVDLYGRAYAELERFLREELEINVPISDQNMLPKVLLSVMRDRYDFVENHFYWDHPNFPETPWQLPSALANTSAIPQEAVAPGRMFPSRIFGKPMMITEFDYAAPNAFRAEGAVLTGAYAALQDWDGLYRFAGAHNDTGVRHEEPINRFDIAEDSLSQIAERVTNLLFMRGDVKPAASGVGWPYGESTFREMNALGDSNFPVDFGMLGFYCRIGSLRENRGFPGVKLIKTPKEFMKELSPAELQAVREPVKTSETGEIVYDTAKGTLRIVSPRSESLSFFDGSLSGNVLQIANGTPTFQVVT